MSKRSNRLLLEDMLEAANKIKNYTQGYDLEKFIRDEKTVDAVIRNFEIIGEAANRLDTGFKDNIPVVDWNKLRGFRNRIVHDYFGIDYQIVWTIIEEDITPLIKSIEKIIEK